MPRVVTASALCFALLLTACGGADPSVSQTDTISVSAAALTAEEAAACVGLISALRDVTADDERVVFTNARDEASALGKLDAAAAKLVEGKLEDAVQKLDDYAVKIAALISAPRPKISCFEGATPTACDELLVAAALAAADCIIPPAPAP